VALRGLKGPEVTIVDGNCIEDNSVFIFNNEDDNSAILDGFTITNGKADWGGGGILCSMWGGVYSCSPSITNFIITENSARGGWGVVASFAGDIINITNCTITENTSLIGGGGVHCLECFAVLITNSILWQDLPQEIDAIGSDSPIITYFDIQGGYNVAGNINADPLFIDPNEGDYYLQVNSLCIDAGDPNSSLVQDMLGNPRPIGKGYDMGAYENWVWHVDPSMNFHEIINASLAGHIIVLGPGIYDREVLVLT